MKRAWTIIDYGDPDSNMYGLLPCPKCDAEYAAPFKNKETGVVEACCDECGYREGPVTGEGFGTPIPIGTREVAAPRTARGKR